MHWGRAKRFLEDARKMRGAHACLGGQLINGDGLIQTVLHKGQHALVLPRRKARRVLDLFRAAHAVFLQELDQKDAAHGFEHDNRRHFFIFQCISQNDAGGAEIGVIELREIVELFRCQKHAKLRLREPFHLVRMQCDYDYIGMAIPLPARANARWGHDDLILAKCEIPQLIVSPVFHAMADFLEVQQYVMFGKGVFWHPVWCGLKIPNGHQRCGRGPLWRITVE